MINTMYIASRTVHYLGYILRLRVEFSLNDNILCRHEEWKINVKFC